MHFLIPFEHSQNASLIFISEKYTDKFRLEFTLMQTFHLIPDFDYPLTDLNIPVLSDRMIDVLESVGEFEYRPIETIMLDDADLRKRVFSNGNLTNEINQLNCYKSLVISNYIDCFDNEKSDWEPSEFDPTKVGYIRNLVIQTEGINIPPIFRIKENPTALYITEEAKKALEAASIKGCVLVEVDVAENYPQHNS
ncbi:MAG: hypothetical protein R2780_12720 [Crocinitomicaceae bacterium]